MSVDLSAIEYDGNFDEFDDDQKHDRHNIDNDIPEPGNFDIPEPEPIDPDDPDELLELQTLLTLYRLKFKDELKMYAHIKFENLPLEELRLIRKKFDFLIGANQGADSQVKIFYAMIYSLERVIVNQDILKCEGLTHQLALDVGFQKDLMRLSLKYLNQNMCRPEITVGMKVFSTALSMDKNYQLKKSMEKQKNNDIINKKIDNLNDKFSDL